MDKKRPLKSMPFFLLMVAVCFIPSKISAQSKDVSFLIDTTIAIMRTNSVSKADWDALKATALTKAAGIDNPEKLGSVMRYILGSIGDFHGAFFYNDSTFKWRRNNERPVPDSVMNEWKKGVTIRSMLLGNSIGYLRVPYMSYNGKPQSDKDAQMLNDSLCSLLGKKVSGIVLDLRLNGGGAMFPMMLGLEQLLGTGKIGSFTGGKGEKWYIKEHNFLLDTAVLASLKADCPASTGNVPVVVLIGRGTGSSGEFLAIAFKGRKNTLFLGTETAGAITSVAGYPINQSAYLYLSTGYGADRNGHVYKEAIKPDIVFESPDCFNDVNNDPKVIRAINWINDHK
jgi:C-terminal processing protease CtpA/Prc